MGVFVLLYTDLSIYLLETLSLSLSYMYIYLLINKQIRGCISIPRTYAHLLHHASCIMPYAVCIHTHTHTCTRYLSTVHAILCMYACLVCWTLPYEWLGTGNKRREEREAEKKRCKRISRCILHCTALHCTARSVLHGRVVVSPRLAWPRIASLRFAQSS